MTTEKITIKYNEKEYEIEKKAEEQKVRPKGVVFASGDEETDANKGITVKNYEDGGFFTSKKCECSKDGTTFEKVEIEWGKKKHITIWGGGSVILVFLGLVAYYCFFNKKEKELNIDDNE